MYKMKGGSCSACSGSMMRGGSLASDRVNSFVTNPVKSYDWVPTSETQSPDSLGSVATHQTTGGGKRRSRRSRRSQRGGAGSDFVSTLYSKGSVIAPEANVMALSKNFTSEGNLTPFKELVSPTNSPLLNQQGGRSRRRRSHRKSKKHASRSHRRTHNRSRKH